MSSSVQTSYSEWQKRPVPTYRPGAKGSLQETIERAPPYSRVVVIGGVYNEQLVINKPIELIGEEGEEPVVQHKGPVVSIHNDTECYIQHLSFVAKTTNKNNNKEAPAILIGGQAKPVFKNCEITSVMVTTTADPQFVMCTIGKNINGPCISVRDHASGTYLQNKFRDCVGYCIEVCSRGEPRFIDNTVEADTKEPVMAGNGLLHVYGGKDVRPIFTSNRFEDLVDANAVARYVNTVMYSSRRTAVVIDGFSEPLFEDNVFIGSELCVTLRACGGVFRNNTVTSSRSCGIYVRAGCSMLLSENKIQGNATYGIVLDGCDCAHLDGNHISNNSHCGCLIVHSHQFTLANNHFISNAGGGLCVWENAKGTITENDFRMNQRYGAYFYGTECQVTFKQNRLSNNAPTGIICENGCTPQLIENEVTQSPVTGLWITTSANPTVIKNSITECERYCVIVTANGKGKLLKNILRGGRDSTLFVTDGANPLVSENDISEGSISCVLVSEGGIGIFNGNKIRNGAFGVSCRLYADPLFFGNFITNCGEGGIVSEEEGVGTFIENIIEKCANGFVCDRGGEAAFRNNLIKECTASGAFLKGGSRALVEKNKFDSNAIGINIRGDDSQSIVRQNHISNSTTFGVISSDKATGEVVRNHILVSGTAGLASVEEGNTFFHKNRCTQDRGHGILCRKNGISKFRDNIFEFTCGSGVLVEQDGKLDIEDCTFTGCKGYGIEISQGSEGTITNCEVSQCEIGFKGHGACKTQITNVKFDGNKEFGGILVDNAEAILKKCTFSNHPKIALAVRNAGASLLEDCEFIDNHIDVESTLAGAQTTLRKCRMSGEQCKVHVDYHASGDVRLDDCIIAEGEVGVRFHDRAQGHIKDTHFSKLTKQALLCEKESQGSVTACFITNCEIGCEATIDSKCHITECFFDQNGCNIILGEKAACEFARCDIKRATSRPGIDCSKSLGSFTSCRIIENENGGLRTHGQRTRTSFTDCQISENGSYGVEGSERAENNFVNCTIEHNKGPGIIFAYHASMHFTEKNTVRNNGYFGIICEDGADGMFSSGMITAHLSSANIKLDPGSQTRFERNKITNAKLGIVAEGSNSTLFHNEITDHKFCAIQIFGKSAVTFDSNEIHDNTAGVTFGYEFDADYHLGTGDNNNNNNRNNKDYDPKHGSSANLTELLKKRRATALAQQGLSVSGGLVTKSTVPRRATVVNNNNNGEPGSLNQQQPQPPPLDASSIRGQVSFTMGDDDDGLTSPLLSPKVNNNNNNSTLTSPTNANGGGGQQSTSSPTNTNNNERSHSLLSAVAEQEALSDSSLLEEIEKRKAARTNPYERKRADDASRVNNAHPTSAIFRNNTFNSNGFDGAVKISQWSAPIFHQNVFKKEKKALVVQDDGRGNVEENEFSENDVGVVVTGPNCSCVIAHNKFFKNRNAIELLKLIPQCKFSIGENIIEDSTGAAIVVKDGCACTIESFEIRGGQNGFNIAGESKVDVSECTFSGVQDCAISVETLAKPTIKKCRFDSGCNIGIRLADCSALVENCVFVASVVAGVVLEHTGCQSKVTKCLFTQNASTPDSVGVLFRNRTYGEVSLCDFHENSYGIRAEDHAEGLVTQCLIHRQVSGGISCTTNASTKFRKCSFAQNSTVDVLSTHSARPELQRCLFRGDAICGIKCSGGGCITTDCAFRGYSEAAIHFVSGTGATVSRCFFTANECALLSTGKTPAHACDFVSNLVEACRYGGRILLGSGVSFSNNIIRNCEVMGLELRHLGQGCSVSHNYITKCGDRGIRVHDLHASTFESATTMDHNIVTDFSTGYGVEIAGGVEKTFIFQENYISGNCRNGLNVVDGQPRVVRNQISNCDHGMTIQKNCSGFFEGNVTHSCARIGTLIYSATADISKNFFCSTGESGALEVKNDPSGNSGSRQGGNVRGNDIKNNYVPHWAKLPDIPTPDFVTVSDVRLSKEEQQAMTVLRTMYQEDELPSGPECLCDLVAPIAPTARDISRVNMLARPKGQSKSASERAAEALASMKNGNNNKEGGGNNDSLAGSVNPEASFRRGSTQKTNAGSPFSSSMANKDGSGSSKPSRTKSLFKKVATLTKVTGSPSSKSLRNLSESTRGKSFASPTGTIRNRTTTTTTKPTTTTGGNSSSPKPPKSSNSKSMMMNNTRSSGTSSFSPNRRTRDGSQNNNNNENENNDNDDNDENNNNTKNNSSTNDDDGIIPTQSTLDDAFGDGPRFEKSEIMGGGSSSGDYNNSSSRPQTSETSKSESTQYSSNAELLSLSSGQGGGRRDSLRSDQSNNNNKNYEDSTTNDEFTNNNNLQAIQNAGRAKSIIAQEIVDNEEDNNNDDEEAEQQQEDDEGNNDNQHETQEYIDDQEAENNNDSIKSDNNDSPNNNTSSNKTGGRQHSIFGETTRPIPLPNSRNNNNKNTTPILSSSITGTGIRKDSSSSKVHTVVMSLGGINLHPTASMDQTRIQREMAIQEQNEKIHGGFQPYYHHHEQQQDNNNNSATTPSPRKALQAMQMSLTTKDNIIRQKVRENSSGISIRQSQQNWMLSRFSNNNSLVSNSNSNQQQQQVADANNNANNSSAQQIPSFYTGQEGKDMSQHDRQKLLSTLMQQHNNTRRQQRYDDDAENNANNNNMEVGTELAITGNNNNRSRSSQRQVGFVTASVNTNVEDLRRHRSHDSEYVHPIEEEEDEVPVGESFKITSLSYENGQEMTDGVANRSVKEEFVSPSALAAHEEDIDNFDPKTFSGTDNSKTNNNRSHHDDPDLESPSGNNNNNNNNNNQEEIYEDEADADYRRYLEEQENEPDETDGLYPYQGRNQQKKFVPSPPPPPLSQSDVEKAAAAQTARNLISPSSSSDVYSKSARLADKVKGYQKNMGLAFFHQSTPINPVVGLHRGSPNRDRIWGTSPTSIPISKRKNHSGHQQNDSNDDANKNDEDRVVDEKREARPKGGHLPYHPDQQQQLHWSSSSRSPISPSKTLSRKIKVQNQEIETRKKQEELLKIVKNEEQQEQDSASSLLLAHRKPNSPPNSRNRLQQLHPSPLRQQQNQQQQPYEHTKVLTNAIKQATGTSNQVFSSVPSRTKTELDDPSLASVAVGLHQNHQQSSSSSQQNQHSADGNSNNNNNNKSASVGSQGYAIDSDYVTKSNNNNKNMLLMNNSNNNNTTGSTNINNNSWSNQLASLRVSGKIAPMTSIAPDGTLIIHDHVDNNNNNTAFLPQIQQNTSSSPNKNHSNSSNHQPPAPSTYLSKRQQEKLAQKKRLQDGTLPPSEAIGSSVAGEAAKLQKHSRDVKRTDLFHSTTAQMFAAFDRKAGALGKIM